MMRSNWIAGTGRGSYALTFSGWSPAELPAASRGTFTIDAQNGSLIRFGPAASTLKFNHLEATLTTGKSLAVISQGKLENAQELYDISGVASFAHKLDLRFRKRNGRGFAVTGTLEEPHVETVAPAP